jgi:hypothetical protein
MTTTWRVLPKTQDELDAMWREREAATYHAAADLVEAATNDYTDEDNARDACMSLAEQLRAKAAP